MCLLIAGIACIIPMYIIFSNVPKIIGASKVDKHEAIYDTCWVFGVILFGIILNIILTHSGIINISKGFENSSATLSDGSFFVKLLCNCLVIPILEELLMRGIICGQLYLWYGTAAAVIISSICFGIIHNNIVQFIYAVLVGITLGFMYIKTKLLSLCILAHCMINFTAIIF